MKPTTALLLSLSFLSAACVEIDGGAVEISWVIRSETGSAITDCGCASPSIATVRLKLTGVGGTIEDYQPCAGNAHCDFPCGRQTGSTPFNIKETHGDERYQVSIAAVGTDYNNDRAIDLYQRALALKSAAGDDQDTSS